VQQFERRLKFLDVDTELVDKQEAGSHVNAELVEKQKASSHKDAEDVIEIRNGPSYTDFLVVFTLDYSEAYSKAPPKQLVDAIHNRNCLCGSDNPLIMWILKLHPDDFRLTDFGKHPWWHQLIGTEYQGRFKGLEKEGWDNEQTKAAQLINDHPSCKKHSPICPNHKIEQSASPRFTFRLPKLFGQRGSPT